MFKVKYQVCFYHYHLCRSWAKVYKYVQPSHTRLRQPELSIYIRAYCRSLAEIPNVRVLRRYVPGMYRVLHAVFIFFCGFAPPNHRRYYYTTTGGSKRDPPRGKTRHEKHTYEIYVCVLLRCNQSRKKQGSSKRVPQRTTKFSTFSYFIQRQARKK